MEHKIRATLKLENGMKFQGYSFGYNGPCDGEVVFSTAMVGYTESLTDPSYSGQILCITYPIVGNYGVPEESFDENGISRYMESDDIYVRGLIVSDYSADYSHWKAVKSLGQWLEEHKVPGIYGVDTRELTKVLRENGSMLGIIVPEGQEREFPVPDPNKENQVAVVSCKEVIHYGHGSKTGSLKKIPEIFSFHFFMTCKQHANYKNGKKKQNNSRANMIFICRFSIINTGFG